MFSKHSATPASAEAPLSPYRRPFSTVYVEQAAISYPRTQRILSNLPEHEMILCRDYREIFNRTRQNPVLQKNTQALILAVSDRARVYEGAPVCQDFGNDRFYYSSDVMNCVFDCEYCYLQGMYPSGNIVVFVNLEDTFAELDSILRGEGDSAPENPAYVCISYDTDLLALEPKLGYVADWINYAENHPGLTLELRTKSASIHALRELSVSDRVILAITLSPDPVIRAMEHRTPTLSARLKFAAEAIKLGWKVRLCFDPMIAVHDAAAVYNAMFDEVTAALPMDRIHDASVGLFRISREYLKEMRRNRPCAVTCYPYELSDGVYRYPAAVGDPLTKLAVDRLSEVMPRERIFLWDDATQHED
ncbi:MAG: radical SAM protein [Lachnospiraceae bacterium]|nr:radical SAM protein [Lachnospiraceae bacterium]